LSGIGLELIDELDNSSLLVCGKLCE